MLPRNHYTRTKTGIVIGCAAAPMRRPEIDEYTTTIQQALLGKYRNPAMAKWAWRIYLATLVLVFGLLASCTHQYFIKLIS